MYLVLCAFFMYISSALSLQGTVHVIGDSHSFFSFTNQQKEASFLYRYNDQYSVPFNIHWIGPRTMYRFGQGTLSIVNIQQYGVQEGDTVVFVFGEIDVRCHIGKQRDKQGVSLGDIIEPLVEHYLDAIEENRVRYKSLQCVVCSVVPPTDQVFNDNYPRYGSIDDRIEITKYVNNILQIQAIKRGILFLDIYSAFATTDGDLNRALSDGIVHIGIEYNDKVKNMLCMLLPQLTE